MNVLVTDANNRVALAVTRALGRAGCRVTAVEQKRFSRRTPAAFLSRFTAEHHVVPNLEDGFAGAVAELARRTDVVCPVSTNVIITLAENRRSFPRLPVPPLETLRRANDKEEILKVAREAGVPVPESYSEGRVVFPAVVKMRDDEGTYLEPKERYRIVDNHDELERALAEVPRPVIQEKVEGDAYGCGFLAREGELLAAFCHRRRRESPPAGGPSALCESVHEERLVEYARVLARVLRWTGVAMAEFKGTPEAGYRLLELNPRFWGSLPLAVRAGINFPWLLCRMAMGEEIAPAGDYPAGKKLRFLSLDAPAALRSRRSLGGFLRDLLDPRIPDGILDPDDWRASVAYIANRLCAYPSR